MWILSLFIIFTQHDPLKGAKIWLHGASQEIKLIKYYLTKHISYKKQHIKKFHVIDKLKGAINVDFQPFWAICTQHDP